MFSVQRHLFFPEQYICEKQWIGDTINRETCLSSQEGLLQLFLVLFEEQSMCLLSKRSKQAFQDFPCCTKPCPSFGIRSNFLITSDSLVVGQSNLCGSPFAHFPSSFYLHSKLRQDAEHSCKVRRSSAPVLLPEPVGVSGCRRTPVGVRDISSAV